MQSQVFAGGAEQRDEYAILTWIAFRDESRRLLYLFGKTIKSGRGPVLTLYYWKLRTKDVRKTSSNVGPTRSRDDDITPAPRSRLLLGQILAPDAPVVGLLAALNFQRLLVPAHCGFTVRTLHFGCELHCTVCCRFQRSPKGHLRTIFAHRSSFT